MVSLSVYFLSCGLMEVVISREMTTREAVEKAKGYAQIRTCVVCSGLTISLLHSLSLAFGLLFYDLEGLNFQEFPLFVG